MQRIITLFILLSYPLLLLAETPTQDGAVIAFKETTFDFGNIFEEERSFYHDFEFENTGTKDLLIDVVRCSSGCMTPEWKKEPIPPKGKGTIRIYIQVVNRPGMFYKSTTVETNATQPKIILMIKGNVKQAVKWDKSEYCFGEVAKNTKLSHTFEFINIHSKPIIIEKVEVQDNWFDKKQYVHINDYSKIVEPNEKGFIVINCETEAAAVVDQSINIYFEYDKKRKAKQYFNVRGQIVSKEDK